MVRSYSAWLLCLLLPWSCFAQAAAPGDWQRVRGLAAGTGITVETKGGEWYRGMVVSVTADSVLLDTDERGRPGRVAGRRDIARADVREIRGLRRGASILAGAGIGAAAGVGLGVGIDLSAKSNEDKGLATVAFTVLGGVLGALIGRHAAVVKGARIYVSP